MKLRKVTDIEKEFNQVYGNFVDAKLPKDDLYWQIKQDLDKKDKITRKIKGKNILPKVHGNKKERFEEEVHKAGVALELRKIEENGGVPVDEEGNPIRQEKPKEPTLVPDLETQKMAFKGDFEKIDDEIKIQIKALGQNDMVTLKKAQNQEMSN